MLPLRRAVVALIDCKECGNKISNKATACPSCGVVLPKRVGLVGWIFAAFFGMWIFSMVLASSSKSTPTASPTTTKESLEKAAEIKQFAAGLATTEAIKKISREPESVRFETVTVSKDASTICVKFRAKNGFGGTNIETIVMLNGTETTKEHAWLIHCSRDMRELVALED
jgi:hypothetical protein